MRGFWIDEKADYNLINKSKVLDRIFFNFLKKIENIILRRSFHIVVLTRRVKNFLINEKKLIKNKISVICCSVDYDHFEKVSKNSIKTNFFAKYNLPNDAKIICYCGSIGPYYMIDEMLDFYEKIVNVDQNFFFLFITNQVDELKLKIVKRKFNNKIIYLNSEWKDIPKYLAISNLMISFIKPTFAKIASSPTKIGEAFSVGLPVISNKGIGDLDSIIIDNNLDA